MRLVFGVLGLLIVLAIVGSLAKKQLQAVRAIPSSLPSTSAAPAPARDGEPGSRLDRFPGAVAADPGGLTVPQQSQNLQQQIRQDVQQSLQQGAANRAGGQ